MVRAIMIVLVILFVGALAMVIANDFNRAAKCQDLGGVYHRGQCLDASELIRV